MRHAGCINHGERGLAAMTFRFAGWALAVALTASPAAAAGAIDIPEPGDPWLFALGVVGLLVGRHASRKKPPE
jgi:hypothetical protein